MIKTVNIVEYADDDLLGVVSFEDTDEGNREAEERFEKILIENEVPAEDIDSFLEDGYWEQGAYQVFLTHSGE